MEAESMTDDMILDLRLVEMKCWKCGNNGEPKVSRPAVNRVLQCSKCGAWIGIVHEKVKP
jgi:translation initiation factor 2 beta subunit (eIF-2beta)/eIF-5